MPLQMYARLVHQAIDVTPSTEWIDLASLADCCPFKYFIIKDKCWLRYELT